MTTTNPTIATMSSSSSLPASFNISNLFNTPMERSTYSCWCSQFLNVLEIHDLHHHIDDNKLVPPEKLPDASINPAFGLWKKTDKLVLSWIQATVSPSIQTLLLPCKTTKDAWTLLDRWLSPFSKIHIRHLCDQLHSLRKESDKPISEFLLHAKNLFDSLVSADAPLQEQELIEFIIDGLGSEFKEFITTLHLRPSVSLDEFYDLLIQEEHLIKKNNLPSSLTSAFTAHNQIPHISPPSSAISFFPVEVVHSSHPPSYHPPAYSRGRGNNRGKGHNNRGSTTRGGYRSNFPNHHGVFSPSPRPSYPPYHLPNSGPPLLPTPPFINHLASCQICNKRGHTAR